MALGLGYLWHTRMLTNEKVFRMVALVHDIDLDSIAEEETLADFEVPSEEISLDDIALLRDVKLRDHEVKMNALIVGTQEFERSFRDVNEGRQRFDTIAQELKDRLNQQKQLASRENLAAVVGNLEAVKPDKAKDLLLMFLNDPGGERDVIILMKEMQPSKRQAILQQFDESDLKQLHKLNQLMLDGFPERQELDSMLEQLLENDSE